MAYFYDSQLASLYGHFFFFTWQISWHLFCRFLTNGLHDWLHFIFLFLLFSAKLSTVCTNVIHSFATARDKLPAFAFSLIGLAGLRFHCKLLCCELFVCSLQYLHRKVPFLTLLCFYFPTVFLAVVGAWRSAMKALCYANSIPCCICKLVFLSRRYH